MVSHEASQTGAPILALNIAENFSKNYNVITILVRGGELEKEFAKVSTIVLKARFGVITKGSLKKHLQSVDCKKLPIFAIVNSVVSAGSIQPIRNLGIATVLLVHEFGAYIRPKQIIDEIDIWTTRFVFSSKLTYKDLVNRHPTLRGQKVEILEQGQCKIPKIKKSKCNEKDETMRFIQSSLKIRF